MKHYRKVSAISTAAMMLCAALPAFPAAAASDVPSWVPTDFEQAVAFQNSYGGSHAEHGVYCIVARIDDEKKPTCTETLTCGDAECIFSSEIVYEVQDGMPDLSKMSAKERAEWEAKLAEQGMIEAYNKNVHYFVSAWKPTKGGTDVEVMRQYSFAGDSTEHDPVSYTFTASSDLAVIAETGWRAIVPDCETEYDRFLQEHGNIYATKGSGVADLILAGTVNYSTGADMSMGVSIASRTLVPTVALNCRAQGMTEPAPGTAEKIVQYYPIEYYDSFIPEGRLKAQIEWTNAMHEVTNTQTAYYDVRRDLSSTDPWISLEPVEKEDAEKLPDWVPRTASDACRFRNTYGSTHVEDDLICIVTRHDSSDFKRLPLLGCGDYDTLLDEWYRDAEAKDDGTWRSMYGHYHVTVYKPKEAKTVVFYDYENDQQEEVKDEDQYIFAVNEDLHVKETDWRGFVPDSFDEYNTFINSENENIGLGESGKHGSACNIDGVGSYLVMTARTDAFAGGYSSYMFAAAKMDGKELQLKHVECGYEYDGPEPTDQPSCFALYNKITKPGKITASFSQTYQGEKDYFTVEKTLTAAQSAETGAITVTRDDKEALPDWIPNDAASGKAFYQKYGAYHTEKGIICLCLPYEKSDSVYYVLDSPGSLGDFAAHKVVSSHDYAASVDGNNVEKGYHVVVIKVSEPGNVGMKWVKVTQKGDARELECKNVLFFTADKDLNIKSGDDDAFAFLPKNYDEAKAFDGANWPISVQDGVIVCCGETNVTTGYEIIPEFAGSAGADIVRTESYSYTPDPTMDGGNSTYRFFVVKPEQKGLLKVTLRHAREWDRFDGRVLMTKYYAVGDDLSLTEVEITAGDIDGDRKTTTSDLVAVTKYVTGQGALSEKQFFAADLRNDNAVNAADLSVMKRWLMEIKNPPPPAN
ncbi:MAG: dockerin type I repeat-containing protein [Oscillospiraceae bacterium]|nr:dockerin type I repeat-containing protein [Oscillospiraceae bacterium]